MEQTTTTESALVAELNDLLQLDHDAIQAYTVAIHTLSNDTYRRTLESYRRDHERHVRELTELIRAHGGVPIELPHLPSGVFKLAMQTAGAAGGDRGVLLAFKANERQVRDKYRRVANARHPEDVALVLVRAAQDEATHYAWALETLEELGVTQGGAVGRVEQVVEVAHARMADTIEGVEKGAMALAERARRGVRNADRRTLGLGAVLLAAGTGLLAARLFRSGRT